MTFVLQSRTDHTDAELIKEGRGFDIDLLLAGTLVRLGARKEDAAVLGPAGYDDEWAGVVQATYDLLKSATGAKGVAKADRSASQAAGKAQGELVGWVKQGASSIKQAPRAVRDAAPKLHSGWAHANHLVTTAEALQQFCAKTDFRVVAARSAAFAVDGKAKLEAYEATHAASALDTTSAEVQAVLLAAGLLAFELGRLSEAAKAGLPAARAALYKASPMRHGSHGHTAAPAATPTPPASSNGPAK